MIIFKVEIFGFPGCGSLRVWKPGSEFISSGVSGKTDLVSSALQKYPSEIYLFNCQTIVTTVNYWNWKPLFLLSTRRYGEDEKHSETREGKDFTQLDKQKMSEGKFDTQNCVFL